MSAHNYQLYGPVRAQDGRQVYAVVRVLQAQDGITPRGLAVAECLTQAQAKAHADALNQAAAEAAALTLN